MGLVYFTYTWLICYTREWSIFSLNVGKYTSPMDLVGKTRTISFERRNKTKIGTKWNLGEWLMTFHLQAITTWKYPNLAALLTQTTKGNFFMAFRSFICNTHQEMLATIFRMTPKHCHAKSRYGDLIIYCNFRTNIYCAFSHLGPSNDLVFFSSFVNTLDIPNPSFGSCTI